MDWQPIFLSLKLAFITTLLLILVSIPLANWMAKSKWRGKPIIEALISLPLVLPPTVIGFYLLLVFSPNKGLGAWSQDNLGLELIFSFEGLVLASMIYSLPFMVQPIHSALSKLPNSLTEASYVLGKSKFKTLIQVLLPNIKPALLTGLVLSFAHTIGEFGVVLMIGGNIPGETKVASIAIYDEVESLNYGIANTYSLVLLGLCFGILLLVYMFNGGHFKFHEE